MAEGVHSDMWLALKNMREGLEAASLLSFSDQSFVT